MTALELVAAFAGVIAAVVASMRWLLVAQREHYIAGSALRFAGRWWWAAPVNRVLLAAMVLGAVGGLATPAAALVGALAAFAGPFGFPLRGRAPGPVAWTRRLRTLAVIAGALFLLLLAAGGVAGRIAAAATLGAAAMPAIVDVAMSIAAPIEQRLGRRWIDLAEARLRTIAPRVVGITGSFGKTSTKNYVAHLAGANRAVVASPRSFNNAAGLAIAVNQHLAPGTEVFVAEMGTYGAGEIARLCEWLRPSVAVITAIGPVHLERFRSEDRIVEAKREILDGAEVVVLNVDDARLRSLAEWAEVGGTKRARRCSSVDPSADVSARVEDGSLVVRVARREIARAKGLDAHPGNVACAVAVALELGTPEDVIAKRLPELPAVANRLTAGLGPGGATVLDDTFNSNPAGAAAALDAARRRAAGRGKLVVVTPGMIELGPRQHDENAAFARAVAETATHLLVVGITNRRALRAGAEGGRAEVVIVDQRDEAIAWVRENVGDGDVVLYENDLPDHYP